MRRKFLLSCLMIGSALPLLAEDYPLLAPPATLDTTGGRSYPTSLQEMFLDPIFLGMNVWPIDQPASFDALLLQDQFLLKPTPVPCRQ
jgi:hypothetical protein